jgi:hypothetical protein
MHSAVPIRGPDKLAVNNFGVIHQELSARGQQIGRPIDPSKGYPRKGRKKN